MSDYIVEDRGDGTGLGVYALRAFARGELIAEISGEVVSGPRLHTLQLTRRTHLYDPGFTGCLLHACDPNAVIYPDKLEVWACRDIASGEAITVDYAATEDRIVKQFACACHTANCRRWIMGRKEKINAEGSAYLARVAPA